MFKWYLARIKKEIDKILKCLRSNRGGEFISHDYQMFLNEKGIKRETFGPKIPPQNGIVERRNRSKMNYARTLMMEKKVSLKY